MAVLKDLIVHGPSKFIGKTQFNTINARSIGAKEGIFEKLIATTLNAETATIDDLTAQNATVVGLLDVQGELHTNAWTNANIANIGGSFYISPSVETVSGTITINKNASNWTVQITGNFATDFIKTAGATTASAWPVDSLVLITGNIVVNNMDYPLGTLKGKLTAQVAASAATTSKTITMTCASTYVDNPNADVLQMLYEANGNANITNAAFSNGKISMYKISGTKPIGILLSSVGITAKGSNYIDIYGGTNNDGTPNLRIGHLTGLPAISLNGKSMTPTGWGLYADNAYLSGTIHSAAGIIGGFIIESTNIHNGKTSCTETTNNGVWVGTDGIGFGKGVTYFSTDGTGKIGPWTLSTTYIRNGAITGATNTSVAGVYLGTDGLNISNGTAATTAYITKTAVNIGNKLTWNGSTLSVNGAITATSLTVGANATITDSSGKITNSTIYSNLDNFTILWNYENFSTANNGEGYICKYDPATGTKSDANGTVLWNGTKRTITKQMINPNTIPPYNTPIYVVCRLSSATATTGTNYMVWYNDGWKYAAMPTPSAVGGTWTWAEDRDIILGKFVEPSSEAAFIECEVYNPPWSSKQVTSVTTTAASAQALANTANTNAGNAAKTATNFLSFDSTNGLKIAQSSPSTATTNMVQIKANDIRIYGNSANGYTKITSSGMEVFANINNTATSLAQFGTTARIGANNASRFLLNTNSIQGYGVGDNNTIVKYFEITQDGIYFGADGIEGATADSINGIMEQLTIRTDDLETTINKHITQIDNINTLLTDYSTIKSTVNTYLGSGKILYNSGANLTLKSTNFSIATTSSAMSFKQGNTTVGSISNSKFNVPDMIINSSEQLGTKFKWVITTNRVSLMRI